MTNDERSTQEPEPRQAGGNGIGVASYATASVGLGPVGLVLGAIGIRRWRDGEASRRDWPVAGVVVGAVATLAVAVLAVLVAAGVGSAATTDARAQADVIALGNAVVDTLTASPNLASVDMSLTAEGYEVEGESVAASLPAGAASELGLAWTSPFAWCVTLTYEGGTVESVSYAATEGMIPTCS